MSLAFRVWWKQDEIAISSLKSCDFPPPFFPPFLNASWFLLALNGNTSSALQSLVDGTGLGCHLWPQSGALVMFHLFAPGCLMENMVAYRGWLVFPHLSWNLFSGSSKKPQNPSGVGFVFRLVEGQTLPITAGFSKFLPHVVFLSWQVCSLGGWAALFFHPNSPATPMPGEMAAFTAATFVQRSCVCGCVSAGVCEHGRCVQSLQSHPVKSKKGVGDPHLRDSPLSGDLCS